MTNGQYRTNRTKATTKAYQELAKRHANEFNELRAKYGFVLKLKAKKAEAKPQVKAQEVKKEVVKPEVKK